jgi:hypothetical protein
VFFKRDRFLVLGSPEVDSLKKMNDNSGSFNNIAYNGSVDTLTTNVPQTDSSGTAHTNI